MSIVNEILRFCLLAASFILAVFIVEIRAENIAAQTIIPRPTSLSVVKVLEGVVSTEAIEFNSAYSAKHNELYFTRASENFSESSIWAAYLIDDGLDKNYHTKKLSIDGVLVTQNTSDVHISANGKQLFFVIEAKNALQKSQIYSAYREGNKWENLQKVSLSDEQTKTDLYYPNTSQSGHLYFSQRNKNTRTDIYRAEKTQTGYAAPLKLPNTINTEKLEGDAFIAPDESYLIFSRMNDENGKGMSDLYISFNIGNMEGEQIDWSEAINMTDYNTAFIEGSAFVTQDGKTIMFTSNREADNPKLFDGTLDIYAAHFDIKRWKGKYLKGSL
jgi:hypothetical protein